MYLKYKKIDRYTKKCFSGGLIIPKKTSKQEKIVKGELTIERNIVLFDRALKMQTGAFYRFEKALFVLKIFDFKVFNGKLTSNHGGIKKWSTKYVTSNM